MSDRIRKIINSDIVQGFLRRHAEVENAPRTVCPECQFETSTATNRESHAPGCTMPAKEEENPPILEWVPSGGFPMERTVYSGTACNECTPEQHIYGQCPHGGCGFKGVPFFSEHYLYELLGKEDARTLLALVKVYAVKRPKRLQAREQLASECLAVLHAIATADSGWRTRINAVLDAYYKSVSDFYGEK